MNQTTISKQSIINLVTVLIVTSIAVYLGYQNYQLQNQLKLALDKQAAATTPPRPTLCDSASKPTLTPTPTNVPLDLSDLPTATLNSPADTSNWQTYQNEIYRYQVQYPPDWRIAELLTEDRNLYSESTAEDQIVFTNMPLVEEQAMKQELDDYFGMGVGYTHIDTADGRSIVIQPVTFNVNENPSGVGFEYTPIKFWQLPNDLIATEYHAFITWEMYIDSDMIVIPYTGDQTIRSEPVSSIVLEIERNDGNYDREAFEQIASTFKYY